MFELSQLRCFVAAAEELHFGRAAQRLNMTQSPLSRQIQLLERILNVTLLERTSRTVSLTPSGQVFLIEARRIVRLAESAALSARRVANGDAGRISIGFTAVSGYHLVPKIVAQARASLPNVELDLREMVTGDQVDALLIGLIDVGFVRPPVDRQEFDTLCVLNEPMVAALPAGDARLGQATLAPADFDGRPLIMYSRQGAGYFHNMLLQQFDEAGVMPDYVQHVTQIHSMLGLVHAGLAAAIVPESASGLHMLDVQFRRFTTTPEKPVELHMAWRRDNANPALEPMRRLCAEIAG
ncbi:LysR substrate-binding domain-containing protein [Croceibacterium ferulae]|uniref:LysR substrate-binding domain-containing protein n=1 Tax=Croceibacterium ferulae TaxID=1854641 RepID=UPI000EAFFB09|nr:LysR substrate-binding domain-containing protein [Croceibacterium ferulae]